MHVAILYNEPRAGTEAADQDVIVQRDCIFEALKSLGHKPMTLGCTLNLASLRRHLRSMEVDCVFNLVESLGGTDRLQPLVPLLLDAMHIPYTGSSGSAMLAAADKVVVKRRLRQLGLATPDWVTGGIGQKQKEQVSAGTFIVKARFEHASVGMDDSSVMTMDNAACLQAEIARRSEASGHAMFAERFIEGREFNIAILAVDGEPVVLAPAEIDFSAFPADKPQIVGYDAKWSEQSFEFNATPRSFSFPASDSSLLEKLSLIAKTTWSAFGLGGYARVDFRVDHAGDPFILEINTNPCLSPDAGFAAALTASDYSYEAAIEHMLRDALLANEL